MDARGGCAAFGVAGIENGKALDRPEAEANRRRHNHSPDGSEGQDEMTDVSNALHLTPVIPIHCQYRDRGHQNVEDDDRRVRVSFQ